MGHDQELTTENVHSLPNQIDLLIDVRDSHPGDYAFILASFLRGVYYGETIFALIPKDIFMDNYKKVANTLIRNPNVVVKMASLKEDPNVLLGFSILSTDFQTIHWVYVKSAWRKQGIATRLLPKFPTSITHLNKLGIILWRLKFPKTIFNPFI